MPESLPEYHQRLISQKKEIYKNPPELPPLDITVSTETKPLPKRASNGNVIFEDHKEFMPNKSPEEILRAGTFGGTYFRPITSAVTNIKYNSSEVLADSLQKEWYEGIDKKCLTSSVYDNSINKWGVKCGGSLGMWESSGWISNVDPYGWF